MCGIYGFTWVDESLLSKMIEKSKHRGPDNTSTYTDNLNISLGHNLLAITDHPQESKQPWKTPEGNILIYNGEIFNYEDLCEKYYDIFHPHTKCDTELLAWGLDKFGISFIEQIDSQHAFALWNKKDLTITLSRDHVGIKPLYYRFMGGKGIQFASELKSLLNGQEGINNIAEACFAYTGVNVTEYSFYDGIYKVLPGESITFRGNNVLNKRSDIVIGTEDQDFQKEEFIEEVRLAVHRSMRGIRQQGIFLSGGLDSAILALHASELDKEIRTFTSRVHPNPKKIHSQRTFSLWDSKEITITYSRKGEDFNSDADCAKKLAQELGTKHYEVIHKESDWDYYLEKAWRACEEPMYNWSIPMYQQVNKEMSDAGTVITIAGDMGDELTLGYPSYFNFQKKFSPSLNSQPKLRYTIERWLERLKNPPNISTKISKNDICEYLLNGPFRNLQTSYSICAYQRMDQIGNCSEDYFRRNDRLGMLYSMEGRFPWASKRLMNYCMNINPLEKIKLGQKGITKIAYENLLPEYIINKPKTGWTSPIHLWKGIPKNNFATENYHKWSKNRRIII